MDERISRSLRQSSSFEQLAQLEENIRTRGLLTSEVAEGLTERAAELGRELISQRTGLDLTELSPAEEMIVRAVSAYAALKKRSGRDATRTFRQLRDHGLLDTAELAVAKSKPTQGFVELDGADLQELSFEQIIVDHPDEFSARAIWYARRTLKLSNDHDKPPARNTTPVQRRTEELLAWLENYCIENGEERRPFSNADAAASIGMGDLQKFGRAFGNIQSRIDFACYKAGLPPVGLLAASPFANAWQQEDRDWAYPVVDMQIAAQARSWSSADFAAILRETVELPGAAHVAWRRELREHEAQVRAWSFGMGAPGQPLSSGKAESKPRNPKWTRDELILALDLYLRFRSSPPGKGSPEVAELSELLGRLAKPGGVEAATDYRNANGVYMKMMNFRHHDPSYISEGKVGLKRGNGLEPQIWDEFANDLDRLAKEVARIRGIADGDLPESDAREDTSGYWVFACNPEKGAIDRFLDRRVDGDSWAVRPSDSAKFAPGQLGIVMIDVDRRTPAERDGLPTLEPGIYALCEVESEAFIGTGDDREFWGEGNAKTPGGAAVLLRYLRSYLPKPLTIDELRHRAPHLSPSLLSGFQGATCPISAPDFQEVMRLLEEDIDDLPPPKGEGDVLLDELSALEEKFLRASPEVKTRVSKGVERGPIGGLIKKINGHKCQLCDAMGHNPIGFLKRSGEPYVEAHHIMPVSRLEVGSLSASNIMTLCANHHRQVHYGVADITIEADHFVVSVAGATFVVPRLSLTQSSKTQGGSVIGEGTNT